MPRAVRTLQDALKMKNLISKEEQIQESKCITVMRIDGILQLEDLLKEPRTSRQNCETVAREEIWRLEKYSEAMYENKFLMTIEDDVLIQDHMKITWVPEKAESDKRCCRASTTIKISVKKLPKDVGEFIEEGAYCVNNLVSQVMRILWKKLGIQLQLRGEVEADMQTVFADLVHEERKAEPVEYRGSHPGHYDAPPELQPPVLALMDESPEVGRLPAQKRGMLKDEVSQSLKKSKVGATQVPHLVMFLARREQEDSWLRRGEAAGLGSLTGDAGRPSRTGFDIFGALP